MLLVFAALFLRLWALEILSGHQYLRVARNNQLRTVRLEAPRGPILDRNGRLLVENHAGTAVALWPTTCRTSGICGSASCSICRASCTFPSRRC